MPKINLNQLMEKINGYNRLLAKLNKLADLFNLNTYKYRKLGSKNESILNARKERIFNAILLERNKLPDRVPVIANGTNFFPAKYAKITAKEFMFDYKKNFYGLKKFLVDFDLDMHFPTNITAIGKLISISEMNILKIPGRDIQDDVSFQFYEYSRMSAEEYEEYIKDPDKFLMEKLMPRVMYLARRKGLRKMTQQTLLNFETLKFLSYSKKTNAVMEAYGSYPFFGGFILTPYDILSIILRDLKDISKDLMKKKFREQIIEVLDLLAPLMINLTLLQNNLSGLPGVWFPSERAFTLSPRQFGKYYWPTLKKMIIAFVKNGLIPFITLEGDVTHLLEYLLDLPKSIARKCVFNCDTTDIFKANKILDGHMAIAGNIPLSTMVVGTPHDVEKYCEGLFKELKPNGGFLLSPALGIPDDAKAENVLAMINYAKKFGRYE
ncbi:MAG: uroporphyrinogen decarboxylase family protein [Promethearchaeota archaeon]